MISLIDGIIFNYWLTGKIPAHFSLIMTAAGIFYGVTFMIVCLKVKEGEYPPPPAVNPNQRLSQRFAGGFMACRILFMAEFLLAGSAFRG